MSHICFFFYLVPDLPVHIVYIREKKCTNGPITVYMSVLIKMYMLLGCTLCAGQLSSKSLWTCPPFHQFTPPSFFIVSGLMSKSIQLLISWKTGQSVPPRTLIRTVHLTIGSSSWPLVSVCRSSFRSLSNFFETFLQKFRAINGR